MDRQQRLTEMEQRWAREYESGRMPSHMRHSYEHALDSARDRPLSAEQRSRLNSSVFERVRSRVNDSVQEFMGILYAFLLILLQLTCNRPGEALGGRKQDAQASIDRRAVGRAQPW